MESTVSELQRLACQRIGAEFYGCNLDLKVAISRGVRSGLLPLHGMRVEPYGDTSGWYIWAGEYSSHPDFFVPLHGLHLIEWAPLVLPYLGLPPTWRFLTDGNYEDVWIDPELK